MEGVGIYNLTGYNLGHTANPLDWPTTTVPIMGLTTDNSFTTTNFFTTASPPWTTVIPIWLDSPGTGIMVLPTDAPFPGVNLYPPPGLPRLSITDGVLITVGGATPTPMQTPPASVITQDLLAQGATTQFKTTQGGTSRIGSNPAFVTPGTVGDFLGNPVAAAVVKTSQAGTNSATVAPNNGGSGLDNPMAFLVGATTQTGTNQAIVTPSSGGNGLDDAAAVLGAGAVVGGAGALGIVGEGIGDTAAVAGADEASSDSSEDNEDGDKDHDDSNQNTVATIQNTLATNQNTGTANPNTIAPTITPHLTVTPTTTEFQNWTVPEITIDYAGISSAALLVFSAIEDGLMSVSGSVGPLTTLASITTSPPEVVSVASTAIPVDINEQAANDQYCHQVGGGSSGWICVYPGTG
ncbi:hypothetical protein MMC21_004907 [Puttea exsequens]|nr:hypothetical protein [Puttea exsequens]